MFFNGRAICNWDYKTIDFYLDCSMFCMKLFCHRFFLTYRNVIRVSPIKMNGWTLHYLRCPFSQSENVDCICVQKYENIFFLVIMSIDAICTSIDLSIQQIERNSNVLRSIERDITRIHSIHVLNKAYSNPKFSSESFKKYWCWDLLRKV